MEATIIDEDDRGLGVRVVDNGGVRHTVAVGFDGEVQGHSQDGYSDDPDRRTVAENERVNQARRFARFYVYRERDRDVLDPRRNPDRIAAVALAAWGLQTESVSRYFGDFYRQLLSYMDRAEPVITTPEDASRTFLRVEQDVYLTRHLGTPTGMVEAVSEVGVFDAMEDAGLAPDVDTLDERVAKLLDRYGLDADPGSEMGDRLVETVGPLAIRWQSGDRDEVATAPDTGVDLPRDPDARPRILQTLYEVDDVADFRDALCHHLRCQIRDCYVGMGIAPPESLRVQGPGFGDFLGYYKNHDFYPDYHDPRVAVTDWQVEHTPGDLRPQ